MQKFQTKLKELRLKYKERKGFSMIELIVYIVIIGIIAVVAVPYLMSVVSNARVSTAESSVKEIGDAINRYYAETGALPQSSDMDGLKEELTKEQTIKGQTYGPWMKDNFNTLDAWDHEYSYEITSIRDFEFISAGPDGEFGTDDDISYNELGSDKSDKN